MKRLSTITSKIINQMFAAFAIFQLIPERQKVGWIIFALPNIYF